MATVKNTEAAKAKQREDAIAAKIEYLKDHKASRKSRREAVAFFDMAVEDWTGDEWLVYLAWLVDPKKGFEHYDDLSMTQIEDALLDT